MKGFHVLFTLWIYIQITDCCLVRNPDIVDNAYLSCPTNDTCEAECYRGYIFPTGETKTNYNCQDSLSKNVSSCKRIPVVNITYVVTWRFESALPSTCDSIPTLLSESEKTFLRLCDKLAVDVNVTISHTTLVLRINTTFTVEYYNYTSTSVLEECISLHLDQLKNDTLPSIELEFVKIRCKNETNMNTTLIEEISYSKIMCHNGTEVMNVTITQDGKESIEYYCDDFSKSTDSEWETFSQIFTTPMNSFSTNDGSTTETKVSDIPTKTNESNWEASSQMFTTVENSTFIYGNLTKKSISNNFDRKALYYVSGLAAGILVLLSLIIIIVALCRTKRYKATEVHLQDNEMTELERSYGTSFKGKLIENEFYHSADDVPIVSNDTVDYSIALPYYKGETNLISDENYYSYATSSRQIDVSCDVSKNGTNMTSDENHYSYANSTLYAVAEICNDAVKEETKEEQISEENAVEEPIEMNEVVRDSCQYALVDKIFKTKN